MADQLYLSYRMRGYTEGNMLRHFERMVRAFPFSKLSPYGLTLRIIPVSYSEPPVVEQLFANDGMDDLFTSAREYHPVDCAVQVEGYWDLMQKNGGWQLRPSRVALSCFGPRFEDEQYEHLQIELGIDSLYLPEPGVPESVRFAQENVKSLLHLVEQLDRHLVVERRKLSTESGENFAAKLEAAVS